MMRAPTLVVLLLAPLPLAAQQDSGLPPDSVAELRASARRAEEEVERLSRWLAPFAFRPGAGRDCDEIVGRFCLTYEDGRPPDPPPDPARVVDARRQAIEALRLPFTWLAHDLETAGPLVRYLVEDDRANEAVATARTFAALSQDSVWGPLLIGFALHGMADDEEAERHLRTALARMPPGERAAYLDPRWLLAADDRRLWRNLPDPERTAAADRLWAIADPLYLTAGNERWNEHIARRVWARLLERAPRVREMVRWGNDMEELTIRYGVPAGRSRAPIGFGETSLVEHFDPDQLAFIPPDVVAHGLPPAPPPGDPWPLQEPRSRSGYAPRTVDRLAQLRHQTTRFPTARGVTLRIDAVLPIDSLPAGSLPRAELFVMDAAARIVARSHAGVRVEDDSAWLHVEADAVEDGGYSLEAIEAGSRRAWRARWSLPEPLPRDTGLLLSDPLLARPFGADVPAGRGDARLVAHGDLRFRTNQVVGVYAEIDGIATGRSFDVELSLRRAERPPVLARAASWIGRTLGLVDERSPTELRWTARASPEGTQVLAFDVPLHAPGTGLHRLVLRVRGEDGREAQRSRLILIER